MLCDMNVNVNLLRNQSWVNLLLYISRDSILDSIHNVLMQESRIKSRIETRNGLSTYFWTVLYFTVLDNKINKLMLKTAHYLGFKLDRKGMLSCSDVAAARLLVSSLVSVSWFSCKYIKRQQEVSFEWLGPIQMPNFSWAEPNSK